MTAFDFIRWLYRFISCVAYCNTIIPLQYDYYIGRSDRGRSGKIHKIRVPIKIKRVKWIEPRKNKYIFPRSRRRRRRRQRFGKKLSPARIYYYNFSLPPHDAHHLLHLLLCGYYYYYLWNMIKCVAFTIYKRWSLLLLCTAAIIWWRIG